MQITNGFQSYNPHWGFQYGRRPKVTHKLLDPKYEANQATNIMLSRLNIVVLVVNVCC